MTGVQTCALPISDLANVLALYGSTDNTTFYPLVSLGGSPAVEDSGGALVSLTAYTIGYQYIQGRFTNGSTTQIAGLLVLGGQ